MFWMATAVTLVVGIVALAVILARRRADDLGSVSNHWIAAHRTDSR